MTYIRNLSWVFGGYFISGGGYGVMMVVTQNHRFSGEIKKVIKLMAGEGFCSPDIL